MKILPIIAFILCLNTSLSCATPDATQLVTAQVSLNNDALKTIAQGLIERGVYATIGTVAGGCSCVLTALGIKRACCEENKLTSGCVLTCAGIAGLLISINIALNK